MKILVTGADGQVGAETGRYAWPAGWKVVRLGHRGLDITDKAAIADAFARFAPTLVINLAAYTAVDQAEREPERAFAANRDGPANLAALCAAHRAALIHLSTDYVFDGSKDGAYLEDDSVGPLGVYGASKAAGEAAIRGRLDAHLILRTAWIYGARGDNFVKTMLRLGAERDTVPVVADQIGAPTWAGDIAAALARLAQAVADGNAVWGTYHCTGAGVTSRAGLADAVFELSAAATGRRPAVIPIATADYPTPARRPANSCLDCSKIERAFGIVPRPWRDGLARMLAQLHGEHARAGP